jgi:hypothetical protein
MEQTKHVAQMGQMRSVERTIVGESEAKRLIGDSVAVRKLSTEVNRH